MRWHVVVQESIGSATQLTNEHLAVEFVASFAGLDDQPRDTALKQRLDHAAEALGADLRVPALAAVVNQRRHLPARDDGVNDLPPATVAFVNEVPPVLARQAERSDQAAKLVDIVVRDHNDADVIPGAAPRLVDERLSTHARAARARPELGSPGSLDGAVDSGPGDREQFLEFADGVPAGAVELDQLCLLPRAELGLLAPQPTLGPRDGHAFAGPLVLPGPAVGN